MPAEIADLLEVRAGHAVVEMSHDKEKLNGAEWLRERRNG
jgi:hypothetical protein